MDTRQTKEEHFMDKPPVPVPAETFHSPMIPAATIFYVLSAVLGVPGVVLIFDSDYSTLLLQDLITSGISDASSLQSWQSINTAVTLLACFGPCVMSAGMLFTLWGKPVQGLAFLSTSAQWLLWGINASGIAAFIILIFRLVRYTLLCLGHSNGMMMFYSMCIMEMLMVTQAVFLFLLIRKFLNCCIDSSTSIAYTLATDKLDSRSIPSLAATGFLILSVIGIFLALDRLFTVTIVPNYIQSYYKLLMAEHPAQLSEVACLLCGSIANILVSRYLRRYKRSTERALFEARKLQK